MSKDLNRPVVFSALEVANICGVVNQTAINWIRNGHLKAFSTPGGQYRVYADDLVSFMAGRGMRVPDGLAQKAAVPENNEKVILVVDDDEGLNAVITKYLVKTFPDFSVYQSFDGFDAGAQLVDKRPGIVILDIDLPGIDGLDICRRLKTTDDFGRPYVIIMTALVDAALESTLLGMGADLFFKKPLSLKDLKASVEKAAANR